MADVIDIIHNLSYTADMSVIEAISKQFGAQFDKLVELNKQLGVYQQTLSQMGKDNLQDIKALNAQIDAQRNKIGEVTASIGKQFVESDKLTKSFSGAKDKLSGLTKAGTEFAVAGLHFGEGMKEGITAIAEKIPDMVEKFKEAKESGASTKDILMALGSSIFSLNGLVTIGVQALLMFGEKMFGAANGAKEAEEALKKYHDTLTQIDAETHKSATEEVVTLTVLTQTAANHNIALNQRKEAVEKLQTLYPAYFGNLTQEAILNGNVSTSVEAVTKAIYARARAEASQKKLVASIEQQDDIQKRIKANDKDIQELDLSSAKWSITPMNPANMYYSLRKLRARQLHDDLQEELKEAKADATQFTSDVQKQQEEAGKLMNAPKITTPAATTPPPRANSNTKPRRDELKEALDNDKELQELYKYEQDITEKYTAVLNEDAKQNISRTLDEKIARERDYKEKIERIKLVQKIRINEHREEMSNTSTELNKLKVEHASLDNEFAEQKDVVATIATNQVRDVDPTLPKRTNVDPIAKEKEAEEKRKRQKIAITKDVEEITDMVNQSIQTLGAAISKIYEQQDKALQKQEAAQQTRVDFLVAHADRGNAELLRQEQERLNAIQEKREQVAKKQLALNKILTVSEQAKSMAEAIGAVVEAAVGGDPYTIAARIIAAVGALVAGVATIKSTFSGDAFAEGVVDYRGRGTATSDSNVVRISRGESVITADATQRYAPMLRAMNLGLPLHIPVAHINGTDGYASKKELNTLNHKMDQLIAATEGNSVRVNQHIDRHGVHQLVETARQMERVRWR
jgi:hypothetical protein